MARTTSSPTTRPRRRARGCAKTGTPPGLQPVLMKVQPPSTVTECPLPSIVTFFDSVSVVTTYKEKLAELGIIFCSFSEAVREHPELVKKYLGSVVPYNDNYFATLNSAVFSDGSFAYIPTSRSKR